MKNKTLISLFLLCSILLCGCWHSHDDYDFEEEMRFFPYVDNSKIKMTNGKDTTTITIKYVRASDGCEGSYTISFYSYTSKSLLSKNFIDTDSNKHSLDVILMFVNRKIYDISLYYEDYDITIREKLNINLIRDSIVVFPFTRCMDLVFAKDKGLQEIRTFDSNIWTLIE